MKKKEDEEDKGLVWLYQERTVEGSRVIDVGFCCLLIFDA